MILFIYQILINLKLNKKIISRIKLVISTDRENLQGGFSFEKQKKYGC